MARKLIVEIIGDASSLSRSYAAAEKSTRRFGREMEHAGRGATVATLGVRGLGRALGTLGAATFGGFAAAEVIKSTVDAGQEAIATQAQLARQLKVSGIAFGDVKGTIDEATLSLSEFSGFNADELTQSFTTLLRVTGSVGRSLELNKVAADVARGRHIALAQAAIALSKAESGNVTSLRRLGIVIPKGVSGYRALQIVAAKYAGQAHAGSTATERFSAQLHNAQAIIGAALLPILNKYLDHLSKWLNRQERTGKLQKDVNRAIKDSAPFFHAAGEAIRFAGDMLDRYNGFLGALRDRSHSSQSSTRTMVGVVRLLVDPAYGLGKVNELVDHLSGSFEKSVPRSKAAAAGYQQVVDAYKAMQAAAPTGAAPSLLGPNPFISPALGGGATTPTGPSGPIALASIAADREVGKLIAQARKGKGVTVQQRNAWFDTLVGRALTDVQDIPTLKGQIARLRQIAALVQERIAATKDVTRRATLGDTAKEIARTIRGDQAEIAANEKAAREAARLRAQQKRQAEQAAAQAALARKAARNQNILDRLEFQITKAQAGNILGRVLNAELAYQRAIEKQIAAGNKSLELQQRLLTVQGEIRQTRADIVAKAKAAADKEKRIRQAAQYRALGLTATGDERLPRVAVLLERLRKLRRAIVGTDQNTRANRTFLTGAIADLLGRHGPVTQDTVSKINDFWSTVRGALDKGAKTTLPYFKHLSAQSIVDSLGGGLTGAQRRRLELQLAGIGPGLTVPGARSTAYAAGIRPGIVIHEAHFHGVQNLSQLEDEMEKRQRARAYRRRGAR